jgi:hypothetical protein
LPAAHARHLLVVVVVVVVVMAKNPRGHIRKLPSLGLFFMVGVHTLPLLLL